MTPEAKNIVTQLRAARTISDAGEVRLKDMKVGGKLLGDNGVWNTIKEVSRKKYRGKFYLLNGHTLVFQDQTICQPDHSFRLPHELVIGNLLCKKDGIEEIKSIEVFEGKYRFYHPTLDGDHTFYLNGILVHNATNDFDQVAGEWNTATNWSLDHVALSTEDTTFTGLDGSAALTITTTAAVAKSVDFSTAGAAFTLSGSVSLIVYGSTTLKSGMTWSLTGNLYTSNFASGTLTTNGVSLSSSPKIIAGRSGTFILADTLTCSEIGDNALTGTYTLTLGTSTINCSNVSFAAATLTVNHTGIVNLTTVANGTLITSFGQGAVSGTGWGTVNFLATPTAAATYALQFPWTSGANFVGFNISYAADRRDGSFNINNRFSIAASSTWKGGGIGFDDPTIRPLISGTPIGTAKTITVSAASQTLTFTDVDFRDIAVAATNTPTITGTRVGDCGGNTNVDTDAPKSVYAAAINGLKNWYDNVWSATDEATYAARAAVVDINQFPLPQDTAIIDDKSFSGSSRSLSALSERIGNITATAALTNAQTVGLGGVTYYGNLLLTASNLSVSSTGNNITFDARGASTLDINILPLAGSGNFTVNSYGGTVRLLTNNLTHTGNFTLTRGTLDLNGKTLSTNIYSQSNANTRVLQSSAAGGKIITKALTGTVFNTDTATGLTVKSSSDDAGFYDIAVDIGTSNLTQTADVTFSGGGKKYGDLKVTKHAGNFDCHVTGANTLGVVTLETPDGTYAYSGIAGTTGQAITSIVADGTATEKITIQIPLVDTAGTNTVTNCTITNSAASGGATFIAELSAGNTNVSGNTGWIWSLSRNAGAKRGLLMGVY